MNINGCSGSIEDVGFRFLLFRKAIKRTQSQLALELGVNRAVLAAVERGGEFPEINFLHYFKRKYGLNINWILCKEGDMFMSDEDRPPELDGSFAMKPRPGDGGPGAGDYREFIQLMGVPAIREFMLARLEEVKEKLRSEE